MTKGGGGGVGPVSTTEEGGLEGEGGKIGGREREEWRDVEGMDW